MLGVQALHLKTAGTSHFTPSMEPTTARSFTTSQADILSSRRHTSDDKHDDSEWHQKAHNMEKNKELLAAQQWQLLKEHVGTNAKELTSIKQELKDMKEMQRAFSEDLGRVKHEVQEKLEKQDRSIADVERSLRTEMSQEEARRAEGDRDLHAKFQKLESGIQTHIVQIQDDMQATMAKAHLESNNLRDLIAKERRAQEGFMSNMQEQLDRERDWREAHTREVQDNKIAAQQRLDQALDSLREEHHQSLTTRATHIEHTLTKCADGLRGDIDRLGHDTLSRHDRHDGQLEKERQHRESHAKDVQDQLDETTRKALHLHETHANAIREHLEKYRGEHRDLLNNHRSEGQSLHDQTMARINDVGNSLDAKTKSLELTIENQHLTAKADVQSLRDLLNTSLHARVATTVLPSRVSSRSRAGDELRTVTSSRVSEGILSRDDTSPQSGQSPGRTSPLSKAM